MTLRKIIAIFLIILMGAIVLVAVIRGYLSPTMIMDFANLVAC